jgi:alpha-beta hydrolase superfamily lysophospholipase
MRIAAVVVASTGLVGCAATPYLGVRRDQPPAPAPPPQAVFDEEVFPGAGDLPLYSRSWRPASREPRGVVVIQNGLKDHGDHYAPLAAALTAHGYAAYAFDMRGHGRSAGHRVTVDHFDDLLDDLERYVERVRAREPGRPIFVFGHSFGGAIVTLYAIERHPPVAGVILSGPALELDVPPFQAAAVRMLAGVAPGAAVFNQEHADFSRDPTVVADMDRDPLIYKDGGPIRTAGELVDAVRRIWTHPEQLTVPLLALHGTADKLTAPSGSRDIVARAGASDKTLRLYEGFYHDLVHEPGHERVVGDLIAWLDAHTSGERPASPPASDAAGGASAETRPLPGDRAPSSLDVQIDARGEKAIASSSSPPAATGGLRLRIGVGRIGWLGGLDLRAGSEDGFRWSADAYPLGVGARLGSAQIGVLGGIGGWGLDGANVAHAPAEAIVELPLGPTRLLTRGGLAWHVGRGGAGTAALGVADEASALLALRIGRDERYWADVRAGQGPFLGVTYARRGAVDLWGITLGIDLWGAN